MYARPPMIGGRCSGLRFQNYMGGERPLTAQPARFRAPSRGRLTETSRLSTVAGRAPPLAEASELSLWPSFIACRPGSAPSGLNGAQLPPSSRWLLWSGRTTASVTSDRIR